LLVRLIRQISSKLFKPSPFAMRLERKKRISRSGAFAIPFLGLDFLGAMAKRGARNRRSPEECGREGSRRRDAVSAKGRRTLLEHLF
jgi:hypothetical protein